MPFQNGAQLRLDLSAFRVVDNERKMCEQKSLSLAVTSRTHRSSFYYFKWEELYEFSSHRFEISWFMTLTHNGAQQSDSCSTDFFALIIAIINFYDLTAY
jgi:hypothetical protein